MPPAGRSPQPNGGCCWNQSGKPIVTPAVGEKSLDLTVAYPVLVEVTKTAFYAEPMRLAGQPHRTRGHEHRGRLPSPT
jgi:hypothetical protein